MSMLACKRWTRLLFACLVRVQMEAAYSVISSMRELSQVGQSLLEERVIGVRRWSLRNKWSHKWTVTNTASSSAVLAFRGLRVRIGFHSGLTVPPEYNKNSRRYLYSGRGMQLASIQTFTYA